VTQKLLKQLFLAPMDEAEMRKCLKAIYADRPASNPFQLWAQDLCLEPADVAQWGGTLAPIPAEVACGLRVRAAIAGGEWTTPREAALSILDAKLVIEWLSERADHADVARVFRELARAFTGQSARGAEGSSND
jgi:hypothetical protein